MASAAELIDRYVHLTEIEERFKGSPIPIQLADVRLEKWDIAVAIYELIGSIDRVAPRFLRHKDKIVIINMMAGRPVIALFETVGSDTLFGLKT